MTAIYFIQVDFTPIFLPASEMMSDAPRYSLKYDCAFNGTGNPFLAGKIKVGVRASILSLSKLWEPCVIVLVHEEEVDLVENTDMIMRGVHWRYNYISKKGNIF